MIIPSKNGNPILYLTRASIRSKKHGIDITAKSSKGDARLMAPTWNMVRCLHAGNINEEEYAARYIQILVRNEDAILRYLRSITPENNGIIRFLCYCPDNAFCHTYLLIDWLTKRYPDSFVDDYKHCMTTLIELNKELLADIEEGKVRNIISIADVKNKIMGIEQAIANKRIGYGYLFTKNKRSES